MGSANNMRSAGTLERDGLRQAGPGLMTVYLDAGSALERVSGVSAYSILGKEPASVRGSPEVRLSDGSSGRCVHECVTTSVRISASDEDPAAVQVFTSPSTIPCPHCEVGLHCLVDDQDKDERTQISADGSKLHRALQAQCAKFINNDYTYSSIENQLLPRGM